MNKANLQLLNNLTSLLGTLEDKITKLKERRKQEKEKAVSGYYSMRKPTSPLGEGEDPDLIQAEKQSKSVRKELFKLKRQLEQQVDLDAVNELENKLKEEQETLNQLMESNKYLKEECKASHEALLELDEHTRIGEKTEGLDQQIRESKKQIATLQRSFQQKARVEKDLHQVFCVHEQYYKQMQRGMRQFKEIKRKHQDEDISAV